MPHEESPAADSEASAENKIFPKVLFISQCGMQRRGATAAPPQLMIGGFYLLLQSSETLFCTRRQALDVDACRHVCVGVVGLLGVDGLLRIVDRCSKADDLYYVRVVDVVADYAVCAEVDAAFAYSAKVLYGEVVVGVSVLPYLSRAEVRDEVVVDLLLGHQAALVAVSARIPLLGLAGGGESYVCLVASGS